MRVNTRYINSTGGTSSAILFVCCFLFVGVFGLLSTRKINRLTVSQRSENRGDQGLVWCLASTETMRLIRDAEKGGDPRGMEVGEEGGYIPVATLSPPE